MRLYPGAATCQRTHYMSSTQKIPVLQRTLRVLEALTQRGTASAKQLSMDLDIPPATCYRILNTLVAADWLLRDEVGNYRLSFGISRLGGLASDMARFFATSHRPLEDLAEELACSVKISVREGDDWLILARQVHATSRISLHEVGIRDSAAVGSPGAVLLRKETEEEILRIARTRGTAGEPVEGILRRILECRERGFATNFGQTNPHLHAVSVPLCLGPMEENAALSAVFAPEDGIRHRLDSVTRRLRETAAEIFGTLSGQG